MTEMSSPDPEDRQGAEVPSLANSSFPSARHRRISTDGFAIEFQRNREGIHGLTVNPPGGQILFHPMPVSEGSPFLLELLSLKGRFSDLPHSDDPLPELGILRKALERAEASKLSFATDMGKSISEIVATATDARLAEISSGEIQWWMQRNAVLPGVYHIHMPTAQVLAATFLRFQEHYESPRFRNKVFTREQHREWYASTRPDGDFDYYDFWEGFNVPDYVFDTFSRGRFSPLTNAEVALLNEISDLEKPFYVIGTCERDDGEYLRHETAHGLYHVNPEYRKRANKIVSSVDTGPIRKHLKEIGYCNAVMRDEFHAYLLDPLDYLKEQGIPIRQYQKAHRELNELFKEYAGGCSE